jgi:hypothetical protein
MSALSSSEKGKPYVPSLRNEFRRRQLQVSLLLLSRLRSCRSNAVSETDIIRCLEGRVSTHPRIT